MIDLPEVIANYDGQCIAIDAAIRTAAIASMFYYSLDIPLVPPYSETPIDVQRLIDGYVKRGFYCEYDHENGKLTFDWSHPNATDLEMKDIQRATVSMLPSLGIGFKAQLVYLCMTNGEDLRSHSDITLQRTLNDDIRLSASLGNTSIQFGFPNVPAPSVQRLFAKTFSALDDSGFLVNYDPATNMFEVKWGQTLPLSVYSDEHADAIVT